MVSGYNLQSETVPAKCCGSNAVDEIDRKELKVSYLISHCPLSTKKIPIKFKAAIL